MVKMVASITLVILVFTAHCHGDSSLFSPSCSVHLPQQDSINDDECAPTSQKINTHCDNNNQHTPTTHTTAQPRTMLDINLFLKERGGDPEIVRESQRRRHAPVELVDEIIELYNQWKTSKDVMQNTGLVIHDTNCYHSTCSSFQLGSS